jgi:hypothetical protein
VEEVGNVFSSFLSVNESVSDNKYEEEHWSEEEQQLRQDFDRLVDFNPRLGEISLHLEQPEADIVKRTRRG